MNVLGIYSSCWVKTAPQTLATAHLFLTPQKYVYYTLKPFLTSSSL